MPMGPKQVADPELQGAFTDLMQAVRGYAQPILSVGVKGPGNNPKASQVEQVQTIFLGQIEKTLGEQVIALMKAPEDKPGLIDVSWEFEDPKEQVGARNDSLDDFVPKEAG